MISLPKALASFCMVVLVACQDLAFREDKRVVILSPEDRSTVSLPVSVSWSVMEFQPVGQDGTQDPSRGSFVVFLDRAPMGPGKDLASLAENDESCRSRECPNDEWFRQRHIYVTTETSLELEAVPDTRDRPSERDKHEVTIVLVNGRGKRIGESAFAVEFFVKRRGIANG